METGDRGRVYGEEELGVEVPETAHQISRDSWLQVTFILCTGVNSVFVLGYSGTIMVPLGWVGGVVGLLLSAAISTYASTLLAKLHVLDGKRHIRYRDLAGHIYGRRAYCLTWGLQYVNLFMINTGYLILAGSALKAAYTLHQDDHTLKLPYCIAITGFVCALFAIGIPHLSALRIWLGFSTILALFYLVTALVLSLKDGINAPPRDYSIPETGANKIFTIIGASANLVFAYNTGMIPEIQATIRQPVVKNMLKALYFQFTIGLLPLLSVVFVGYWAYGSSSSSYLLNNVNGPVWLKMAASIAAFLQSVFALHPKNLSFRILFRGGYLTINTLVAALLPFLGDIQSLTGALSTFPLTFILANHMYLRAKDKQLSSLQTLWHWLNVCFFGAMSVAAAIAAIRLIIVDSKTYNLFADM
ncbi:hypothetical protein CRG98_040092 [Punica granatum]|uniref:Amino acid transporter transmembrane domain-containing protein n=1 Tax=Punica granatum TaxID=22663 RepID=A0A2I0I6M5_PUNGR|nr:hypothetical protein CRG98_040092 [Punica granatum]